MASQGPFFVGTGSNIAGANPDWSSPGNITGILNFAAVTLGASQTSDLLAGTNCGFTIPTDATINGIVVALADVSFIGNVATLALTKDGSAQVGTAKSPGNGVGWVDYGSPTDLWGTTWTPAEWNATTAGGLLKAGDDISPIDSQIDAMRLTVYYTEAPPPPAQTARTGGVQVVGP